MRAQPCSSAEHGRVHVSPVSLVKATMRYGNILDLRTVADAKCRAARALQGDRWSGRGRRRCSSRWRQHTGGAHSNSQAGGVGGVRAGSPTLFRKGSAF